MSHWELEIKRANSTDQDEEGSQLPQLEFTAGKNKKENMGFA